MPLSYHKERLISCQELSVRYESAGEDVLNNLTFELVQGERVFLHGENGCGKSTLIKTILQQVNMRQTGYCSQNMQQTRENMQQISGGQTKYTAVRQQSREFACDSRRNLHGIQSGGVIY